MWTDSDAESEDSSQQEETARDACQEEEEEAASGLEAILSPKVGIMPEGRRRRTFKRSHTAGARLLREAPHLKSFTGVPRSGTAAGVAREASMPNLQARRKTFFQRQCEAMTRSPEDAREQRERERKELMAILAEAGGGSVIRGWRLELDLDVEVGFAKFCSACTRLGFVGDSEALFGNDGDLSSLTLGEVAPEHFKQLSEFQEWVSVAFGSPKHFFFALDSQRKGKLFREHFAKACMEKGFDGTVKACHEAFDSCDICNSGVILPEDIMFLEKDPMKRAQYAKRLQLSSMSNWLSDAAKQYVQKTTQIRHAGPEEASAMWKHRSAPRPWMATTFDQMPVALYTRKRDRDRRLHAMEVEARKIFLDHLVKAHGHEVRAIRRALDVDGTFSFTSPALRRYCRSVDLNINLQALWRSLDRNGTQRIDMQDLCPDHARALALFHAWVRGSFGCSCAQLWDSEEARRIRGALRRDGTFSSDKRMTIVQFAKLLKACKCPLAKQPSERTSLTSSLDLKGCGFIYRSDLEWLDKWDPPGWLTAEPSTEAWEQLKELLERHYGHLLRAWRHALDLDNSNLTCWSEFQDACKRVRFKGDVAGAWRALDVDLSGTITMREYDPPSARLLESFKEWAEVTFGSVILCFKALDTDKSGTVTFQELKRACHKMKWHGDVRLLFEALDVDGKRDKQGEGIGRRSISLEEISFLDTWVVEDCHRDDERAGTPWTEISSKRTPSASSRAQSREGGSVPREVFPASPKKNCLHRRAPPSVNEDFLELSDSANESRSRIFDVTPSHGASRLGSPSDSLTLMLTPSSAKSMGYSSLEPVLKTRGKRYCSPSVSASKLNGNTGPGKATIAAFAGLDTRKLIKVPGLIARDNFVDPSRKLQRRPFKQCPKHDNVGFWQEAPGCRTTSEVERRMRNVDSSPKSASMPGFPTPWTCHYHDGGCLFH